MWKKGRSDTVQPGTLSPPALFETHDGRFLIDLGGQIFLTHALPLGVLLVLTALCDGGSDRRGDGRGGFDFVFHV